MPYRCVSSAASMGAEGDMVVKPPGQALGVRQWHAFA